MQKVDYMLKKHSRLDNWHKEIELLYCAAEEMDDWHKDNRTIILSC